MTATVICATFSSMFFSSITYQGNTTVAKSLVGSDKIEAQGLSSLHLYTVVENGTKRNVRSSAVMINSRFEW